MAKKAKSKTKKTKKKAKKAPAKKKKKAVAKKSAAKKKKSAAARAKAKPKARLRRGRRRRAEAGSGPCAKTGSDGGAQACSGACAEAGPGCAEPAPMAAPAPGRLPWLRRSRHPFRRLRHAPRRRPAWDRPAVRRRRWVARIRRPAVAVMAGTGRAAVPDRRLPRTGGPAICRGPAFSRADGRLVRRERAKFGGRPGSRNFAAHKRALFSFTPSLIAACDCRVQRSGGQS